MNSCSCFNHGGGEGQDGDGPSKPTAVSHGVNVDNNVSSQNIGALTGATKSIAHL